MSSTKTRRCSHSDGDLMARLYTYNNLSAVDREKISANETSELSVIVTNTGSRAGRSGSSDVRSSSGEQYRSAGDRVARIQAHSSRAGRFDHGHLRGGSGTTRDSRCADAQDGRAWPCRHTHRLKFCRDLHGPFDGRRVRSPGALVGEHPGIIQRRACNSSDKSAP